VDLEMRYRGGKIDIGIFAPVDMVSVAEAEAMVERFLRLWQ